MVFDGRRTHVMNIQQVEGKLELFFYLKMLWFQKPVKYVAFVKNATVEMLLILLVIIVKVR